MLLLMRITIRLDDQLHMKAKRRAAERGMTLAAFVEESLRRTFDRRESGRRFIRSIGFPKNR
jgi:hypothetical protein